MNCMISGQDIISIEMACETSVREMKMIGNRFLEIAWNNNGSVKDGSRVAEEEDGKCDKELSRNS